MSFLELLIINLIPESLYTWNLILINIHDVVHIPLRVSQTYLKPRTMAYGFAILLLDRIEGFHAFIGDNLRHRMTAKMFKKIVYRLFNIFHFYWNVYSRSLNSTFSSPSVSSTRVPV